MRIEMSFHAYPSQAEGYNSLIRNPFGARQKQVEFIEAIFPLPPRNLSIALTLKKEKKWKSPLKNTTPLCALGYQSPQKHYPSFSPRPLLNLQTFQAPLFRQSPLYIGFL